MDEPRYTSNRTDAASHADHEMKLMHGILGAVSERRRGYIRDAIVEAFEEGEHQGICRALFILSIARDHTHDPAIKALLMECAYQLAPDLRDDP